MSATLLHRGPDSDGVFVDGPVGLAARRLAIIDLETGDQPIANEDGTVHVVQNGELYNYRELRGELERAGHRFRTHGDTEVLVHLYEQEGPAFARRLRGMFAVALWDSTRRRLVLARDRYGIKPLYYRTDGDGLEFASELRSLPRGEIDLDALEAFLAFNSIPAPLTIFREARKLPPGHVLVWEDGNVEPRALRAARAGPGRRAARRRRGRADRGAALAAARLRAGAPARRRPRRRAALGRDRLRRRSPRSPRRRAAEPVRTFSIGFEERSFDELADARLVAERYGTRHRELVLRPDAALLLPALADAFDEPFADSSALPTYLVSQLAAEDVKVALSGEGGDELFGGYYTYVADLLAERAGGLAGLARPLVERLPTSTAPRELRLQGEALRPRRAPAAARAPPRLEGDLLGRRARGADRPAPRLRPGRPLPRALRRDRRRRAAGAAAGRRPRRSTSSTTCW